LDTRLWPTGSSSRLDNIETYFHLLHWDDSDAMSKFACVRGATRDLVINGKPEQFPLKPYAQKPGFKEDFLARMRRDGFEGPQCYYKATARNVQFAVEKDIPRENLVIKDPCLYISTTGDSVCRTDGMELVKDLAPDVTTLILEGNHWPCYESPEKVRERIASWLKEKYP
jgi:soluble epoxide hydrolase / lipid-phosphate phosphatase